MSDERWLWDGSDPEDPEDLRIVQALASARRARSCPELPERQVGVTRAVAGGDLPVVEERREPSRAPRRWVRYAAGLALAAGALAAIAWPRDRWEVRALPGSDPCEGCTLAVGDTIATDDDARWEVDVADIGALRMAPSTSLARLATDDGHLLRLDAGSIDVAVTAPPRLLRVETPAALVVDLGCAYTLAVVGGETRLEVRKGSVALENDAGISVVTAGSTAWAGPGRRPALPVRTDATPAFRSAVTALDGALASPWMDESDAILDALVADARPADGLTLWHALQLVPGEARVRLVDTTLALDSNPGLPARTKVLALDAEALTALWQDLLPDAYAEGSRW